MQAPDPREHTAPRPPGLDAELAAAFARLTLALAEADTDDAVLRAVAQVVGAQGPNILRLYTLHDTGAAAPQTAELASLWHSGVCPAEDPLLGRRFSLADHPVLARWLAAPHQPLVRHDLAADPKPAAHAHERSAQALVVLPLRSEDPPTWLGVLVLSWPIVHIPAPRERAVHELLMRSVAAFLAARRALREHQRELDEASAVYVAAATLAEAADLEEILAALAEPGLAAGASSASLWLATGGDRMVRVAPPGEGEPPARSLAELADLFGRPNELCLVEPVDADMFEAPGALLLPLARDGRPIGLLELGWQAARGLPEELRRLYAAVAGPAAAALAGRALLAEAAELATRSPVGAVIADDALAPGLSAAVVEAVRAAAAAAQEGGAELRRTVADGDRVFELRASPVIRGGEVRGVAVVADITADRRAEAEHQQAREALLLRQAALQARQANPPIPLAPGVVALALAGAVDVARARQLVEVAAGLTGGQVLVDLTGVSALDPDAAAELAHAAVELRARGVEATFTGVRPEFGDLPSRPLAEALAAALVR
jgi:anti-anti-sigma regulatory factor